MSHEIRTPMNAIIGLTEVLLTTSLTDHQHDHLETIRGSGETLLHLLDDILDLSKIEADRMTLDHQLFDLGECVTQVVALLRPRAMAKQLKLQLELAPGLPARILSDPMRLRQILTNLIGNAIKFTEHGSITVDVCPGRSDPARDAASEFLFAIRDTGPGIPAHRMDRLFQPFSQGDTSVHRKHGGTGLGLAISKRLCELMGGTIWVESEPDHGACFFFTIRAIVDRNASAPLPRRAPPPNPPAPAGPSLRVLVVEDNPVNQKVAEALLRHLGHAPAFASRGYEAIDAIEASPGRYHVVLLDVQMPGLDGCEVARQLRRLEQTHPDRPRSYLVALTADALPDDRDRCLAAGMDDYLSKPVRLDDLRSAFQRYLNR
jgi:CheY-like chemotaxis protein